MMPLDAERAVIDVLRSLTTTDLADWWRAMLYGVKAHDTYIESIATTDSDTPLPGMQAGHDKMVELIGDELDRRGLEVPDEGWAAWSIPLGPDQLRVVFEVAKIQRTLDQP